MIPSCPGETPKAAAAFNEYCLLGPDRSLKILATTWKDERTGKPVSTLRQIEEWSRLFQWQKRLILYDRDRAEDKRRKREADLEEMNEDHARIGHEQLLRAVEHIGRMLDAGKFGSQALVVLFKYASDLERLARGAATEIQAVQDTTSYDDHLTAHLQRDPEAARLLAELIGRAAAAPPDPGVAAADDS